MTLSYAGADLTGVNEANLGAYWYNETSKAWEYVGGTVDAAKDTVTFVADHFSKYTVMAFTSRFTDITSHWAKADIEVMAAKGIVGGMTATTFAPEALVTRAQFATYLVRALGLSMDPTKPLPFTDVPAGHLHYKDIAAAYQAGIVAGTSATTFGPETNITREQIAAMIVRALAKAGKQDDFDSTKTAELLAKFSDASQIESYFRAETAKAGYLGIVAGRTATTFAPKANATRAEAIVMVARMYYQLP